MKKGWIWAVLLVALLVISACRPGEDEVDRNSPEAAAAEDLGACQPEDEACVDESALSATPEEEAAPAEESESEETPAEKPAATDTEEPEPEETVEETTAEEPAATDAEVSESAPLVGNPFEVLETDWVMGPDDAFITMIEYGDFQ